MQCIAANAAFQAWQRNYSAIVTDGLVVENLNGQSTNEFHKFGSPDNLMTVSIFDHKISMVGLETTLKKFDDSVLAAHGYAVGNSIPASEANLLWPG